MFCVVIAAILIGVRWCCAHVFVLNNDEWLVFSAYYWCEKLVPRKQCFKHAGMASAYTFDGLVVFGLLVICTCAYMRRVPRLKQWFLSEKKGFWGVFYKASVIGTRLHFFVSVSCVLAGCYLLFIK